MIKEFIKWIKLKERLHSNDSKPPLVSERDLWWISFGENIGSEINGKSKLFSRPGIVLKKLSHGFYLVVPTTTQKREGTWYVNIHHNDKDMYACLHQIRTVDYRRLSTKFGQISHGELIKTKEAFSKLYK